jgi:hypothetical protein
MTPLPHQHEIRPGYNLWWLHPSWVFALLNGVTMLAALLLSQEAYRLYGTEKYVDGEMFALALLGIAAFAAGQWFAKATGVNPPPAGAAVRRRLNPWFLAAVGLSLFGYLVWFGVGALRGKGLEQLASIWSVDQPVEAPEIREELFPTVPGITTCTQFGMAAVALGMLCRGAWTSKTIRRLLLGTLFALAALRMVLVSERLALIELAVPATVIALRLTILSRPSISPAVLRRLRLAPVAAIVGIVLLFGGAEYFRSWRFYQDRFDSFPEFAVWRLSGYYTTAHNNGALAMKVRGEWPMPYYTLEHFWRFPLIANSPLSYKAVNGIDPEEIHRATLERFGTPELNNQGGLFSPAMDFGWLGYAVFWSLYGFVAGRLHRGFLAGSLAGLLFYPLVFVSILEVPRLLYLCSVRSFPTLVLLFAIVTVEAWRVRHAAWRPAPLANGLEAVT